MGGKFVADRADEIASRKVMLESFQRVDRFFIEVGVHLRRQLSAVPRSLYHIFSLIERGTPEPHSEYQGVQSHFVLYALVRFDAIMCTDNHLPNMADVVMNLPQPHEKELFEFL